MTHFLDLGGMATEKYLFDLNRGKTNGQRPLALATLSLVTVLLLISCLLLNSISRAVKVMEFSIRISSVT